MSFLSWIPEPTTIDKWSYLSMNINPIAIDLLEKNQEKINWYWLSENPNAIHILEQNPDKIDWHSLSMNPNAIPILEKNPDKIVWYWLSMNPNAIHMLEQTLSSHSSTSEFNRTTTPPFGGSIVLQNQDKIDWDSIYKNPAIFGIDYKEMEMRMNIIKEELISVALHPDRIAHLFELEEELDCYI